MKPPDPSHTASQAYADYATIPIIQSELAQRLGNYEFRLGHALRDLPVGVRFEILNEVRTGILEAIDHHIAMGMVPSVALSHVLGAYRAPKALAREYRRSGAFRLDTAAILDLAFLVACVAVLATHPTEIAALQNDGLSGIGVWACVAVVGAAAVITRLPLRWARQMFTLTIERATFGSQVLGGLAVAQSVQASMTYNFAAHDLILTLKHLSLRTILVAVGMFAAERHRRRIVSVRKARAFAYKPATYLNEFFAHRFDRVESLRLQRSMEYFTEEEL